MIDSSDIEFINNQVRTKFNLSNKSSIIRGSTAPTSKPNKVGDIYIDSNARRKYIAVGSASISDWLKEPVFYSGSTTVTAGGGDITITLPWDWSGGFLKVVMSRATTKWVEDALDMSIGFETSYDALIAVGYSVTNLTQYYRDATRDIYTSVKTANDSGMPKSATSTTFVLDDDGANTVYVKYFVWA